jgi:nucleoside-diphosphate-sugar epimerase
MQVKLVCAHAGIQLTSISHVEDVAALVAAAVGNPNAIGQHYNACTDRTISLDGCATLIASAMGTTANIVHYEPKQFDIPKGKGFPFRDVHFFASTDKAKRDLGWEPLHNLAEDMQEQVQLYMEQGRDTKSIDFSVDDIIIRGAM